ncbi:uncharacterized protein [Oncorhynchus clarkii lewisi]|uniref:uncharacterized protein isoform X2 n=1 Tax=Oncorhynchus clarkii lewisi TaxID=490388 RepID=UPI0039B98D0F
MRSLSYSPAKEEEDITVKQEVESEAVTVKEEEDAFRVKEEDVTVKGEEEPGYLGPVFQTHLKASNGSKDEFSHKTVLRNRSPINTRLETTAAILLLPYLFNEDPSGLYVRDKISPLFTPLLHIGGNPFHHESEIPLAFDGENIHTLEDVPMGLC